MNFPPAAVRTVTPELPGGTIPHGATHFFFNPSSLKPSTNAWRKLDDDGKLFMFAVDKWMQVSNNKLHMCYPIQQWVSEQAPVAAWNGKGLPPVGTACEVQKGSAWDWSKTTILAHHLGFAVHSWSEDGDDMEVAAAPPGDFRPARTAEQIAAEKKRQTEIARAMDDTTILVGIQANRQLLCEQLIDAGWHK